MPGPLAPLLRLVALGKAIFWDATFTPQAWGGDCHQGFQQDYVHSLIIVFSAQWANSSINKVLCIAHDQYQAQNRISLGSHRAAAIYQFLQVEDCTLIDRSLRRTNMQKDRYA
jgi:hypothetical protein